MRSCSSLFIEGVRRAGEEEQKKQIIVNKYKVYVLIWRYNVAFSSEIQQAHQNWDLIKINRLLGSVKILMADG